MRTGSGGTAEPEYAVELDGLGMRFGARTALCDITARIRSGQITGLMGPDAAGKTTLLRLMAGLMLPATGTVRLLGMDALRLARTAPNSIGYMPQRFGLYEDLSVRANLELHARLRGVEGEEREGLFARLLGFTGLAPFTGRLAGRLSGGMKQKLGIACALLGSPRVLLLDEPGVGVDPLSRRELWEMVTTLCREGMTIIWSTAYLDEAARCPEVLVMEEQQEDEEEIWQLLEKAVRGACEKVVETRVREGEALKCDLLAKLDEMLRMTAFIEERSPQIMAEYRQKLEAKVQDLLTDAQTDESRIAMEVTLFADKICVDEEIVRLRSHVEATKAALESGGSVGRKLDFIAQEMNREANTTLSKANDLEISNCAIDLKTEIEKVREQIQNIE